ncbi:hypothetical protein KKB83_04260 [Patescibacteria group bacterium]|nr:hypothetical protein [Patescibacteria group bacterium]
MTHLYKIKNKEGELVTFKPNTVQLKHAVDRKDFTRTLVLKARQFGFTTFYCIDLLDEALWVKGTTCAILGHEREAVDKIFDIVKRAYTNLPEFLKPKTKTDTKRQYDFTFRFDGEQLDSSIYVALKLRSGTVQNLHITESAYIKDRQELNAGSKQAVPLSGRISEETTGNGFDEFYDVYEEARTNPHPTPLDYRAFFYAWYENPEYTLSGECGEKSQYETEIQVRYNLTEGQLLWRRWKMKELMRSDKGLLGLTGEQLFKQEYPITVLEAFQSGAGNVFDTEKVEATKPNPQLLGGIPTLQSKGFIVWQNVIIGHKYVIGVDPSDGEGADASCIDVWDKDTRFQVAQFYGKIRPDELADLAKLAGDYYNKAYVGVENNMLTCILFLSKIYDNYFFTTTIDEKTAKKTKKIGWNTNSKTRDVMIDEFIIAFEEDTLTINSTGTLGEMKTFVKKENGKREHADGKHDDRLFAGFIALQMIKHYKEPARTWESNNTGL